MEPFTFHCIYGVMHTCAKTKSSGSQPGASAPLVALKSFKSDANF